MQGRDAQLHAVPKSAVALRPCRNSTQPDIRVDLPAWADHLPSSTISCFAALPDSLAWTTGIYFESLRDY